jgi:hypothetical protein
MLALFSISALEVRRTKCPVQVVLADREARRAELRRPVVDLLRVAELHRQDSSLCIPQEGRMRGANHSLDRGER